MDLQALMKEAKEMQQNLNQQKEELESKEYASSVGGGVVTVKVTGKGQMEYIHIEDSILHEDGKEDLEALIMMAVNDAFAQMQKDKENSMNRLSESFHVPGLF